MNLELKTFLALAIVAAIVFAIGSQTEAQERSDLYAPINCDFDEVPCEDVGESRLIRGINGISVNIVSSALRAGHTYTVWWIVFNNPEACADGCDVNDLKDPEVNATVIWATGDAIARFGTGTGRISAGQFTAHLNVGETPFPTDGGFGLPGDEDGLLSAFSSEIHVVLRSHGPAIRGKVNKQITTFDGGCEEDVAPKTPIRKGECADIQFAIHAPVPPDVTCPCWQVSDISALPTPPDAGAACTISGEARFDISQSSVCEQSYGVTSDSEGFSCVTNRFDCPGLPDLGGFFIHNITEAEFNVCLAQINNQCQALGIDPPLFP